MNFKKNDKDLLTSNIYNIANISWPTNILLYGNKNDSTTAAEIPELKQVFFDQFNRVASDDCQFLFLFKHTPGISEVNSLTNIALNYPINNPNFKLMNIEVRNELLFSILNEIKFSDKSVSLWQSLTISEKNMISSSLLEKSVEMQHKLGRTKFLLFLMFENRYMVFLHACFQYLGINPPEKIYGLFISWMFDVIEFGKDQLRLEWQKKIVNKFSKHKEFLTTYIDWCFLWHDSNKASKIINNEISSNMNNDKYKRNSRSNNSNIYPLYIENIANWFIHDLPTIDVAILGNILNEGMEKNVVVFASPRQVYRLSIFLNLYYKKKVVLKQHPIKQILSLPEIQNHIELFKQNL